jgi:type II secretory pathway predicted ATPase ExeA
MYTEFYNLQEKPFDLDHSSRFIYLGHMHKEALATLTYGVMERKGFVLLTGEVGTGKTTILRAMLNDLDKDIKYVHMANPLLSPEDFMTYLTLSAFKNKINFNSKAEFLLIFENFLIRCSQHQKHFLLVIDEAHKLSYEVLEEIRLLSNMETAEEKLLSIFLVGQPELNQKLSDPRCRALLQRISIRFNINPLSLQETEEYISRRLEVAGARKADALFPSAVRKAIHEFSGGFPRMINILSDNLLLLGYSRGQRKLTPLMVKECYQDFNIDVSPPPVMPQPDKRAMEKGAEPGSSHGRSGFWVLAFFAFLAILAAAAFQYRAELSAGLTKLVSVKSKPEITSSAVVQNLSGVRAEVEAPLAPVKKEDTPPQAAQTPAPSAKKAEVETEVQVHPENVGEAPAQPSALAPESHTAVSMITNAPPHPPLLKDNEMRPSASSSGPITEPSVRAGINLGETVIVKPGETLDILAMRVYGRSDEKIWETIQKHNPEIRNVDIILRGQRIFFPAMPEVQE